MTWWQKTLFGLFWASAWLFGRMPARCRYGVGDVLSLVLYGVVRYRRGVVADNLARSFPEKSADERKTIERRFYRYLGEVFVETLSLVSMTERQLRRSMTYDNIELIDSLTARGPLIAAMSHYCQWEFTIGYQLFTPHPVKAVYHPLSSAVAEAFYKKMRARFGTKPVTMKATAREMLREVKAGNNPIVALISDQTPYYAGIRNFIPFLGRPTAFFTGMEKLAVSLHSSVVFMAIRRVRRGRYAVHFTLLYDGAEQVGEDVITRRYAAALEELIRERPEYWMWSHKRWKHSPDEEHPYLP